jgi:hypothetical protein
MENITLTINDLATVRNVIDLASTRGAFRGGELAEVGEIYNRLNQFIEASIAASEAQQDNQKTPPADTKTQSKKTAKGE